MEHDAKNNSTKHNDVIFTILLCTTKYYSTNIIIFRIKDSQYFKTSNFFRPVILINITTVAIV